MFLMMLGAISESQEDLINEIYRSSNALLYHVSLSILHSQADAEDAVSASYIKIMNGIEKISKLPRPQITPYCVMIVKNTSIDMLRKRKHTRLSDKMELFEDAVATDELWKTLDIQEIQAAMARLNQADRYILYLRYDSALAYAQIAEMLEISEEAAKKRGQRALEKLRELFKEGAGHASGV